MGLEKIDGRFRITEIVGRGNMGEVHRAEDLVGSFEDSLMRARRARVRTSEVSVT